MFWQDDDSGEEFHVPDDVVDVRFAIDCRRIPVDHAFALSHSIEMALPWITEEGNLAIHTIHVAGSQNGWERPPHSADAHLMVSRRTKLVIRVPSHRVDALRRGLEGTTLDVDGCPVRVGEGKVRSLTTESTLLARYVVSGAGDSESDFLAWAADELGRMGIRLRKALCGRATTVTTPAGAVPTRSLLLADLAPEESVRLQQLGLGPHRRMGCGVFIPHKGVEAVRRPG